MAKLRPPYLSPTGLQEADAPRVPSGRRRMVIAGVLAAAVVALAWFDGGEEPMHPIAEDVVLPEQSQ